MSKLTLGERLAYGNYNIVDIKMIKLFPSVEDFNITPKKSGTCVAINSKGYLATNYHVVSGASRIIIRGINGDYSKTYKTKIIIEDSKNDLAILKIDDANFKSLGRIPFSIQNKSCEVGSSIFCLGYPLRATMEMKSN
ncbi:MAG: trypsin-like peptidase domain-containing protein [Bacteroidetes bacterium]|nr:trypsin-like peptidase domain-containing protein [Bacteroidota bacterium]